MIDGEDDVIGEVIEFEDPSILEDLDRLEGYKGKGKDNLYERIIKDVQLENGGKIKCWVYIFCDRDYARDIGIPVEGGDWRKYINRKGRI
jgi:gamma-glutamylcyclotransferase (GGCT)/AIG2-like uncharacterized protein YtfP